MSPSGKRETASNRHREANREARASLNPPDRVRALIVRKPGYKCRCDLERELCVLVPGVNVTLCTLCHSQVAIIHIGMWSDLELLMEIQKRLITSSSPTYA